MVNEDILNLCIVDIKLVNFFNFEKFSDFLVINVLNHTLNLLMSFNTCIILQKKKYLLSLTVFPTKSYELQIPK